MFNKFSTGTGRCRHVMKDIRHAKNNLENKREATFKTGGALTIPSGTRIEDEKNAA